MVVGIAGPPRVPRARYGFSSRNTIVGAIDVAARFPGSIAFAPPCRRPSRFAAPLATVKSSMALLRKKPRPAGMKPLPKSSPRLTVTLAMLPLASATTKCVVCSPSEVSDDGSASEEVGVACAASIVLRQRSARRRERRSRKGMRALNGSARYLLRSM
jgi:hypothetical protein